MKTLLPVLSCALALWTAAFTQTRTDVAESRPAVASPTAEADVWPRFTTLDVYVDSGTAKLAAYQVEVTAATGQFMLVGIAGGDHPAFAPPPYYDPAARAGGERVVLAAFNTGEDLPAGKTRVAQLQLEEPGPSRPTFKARLVVAAGPSGKSIPAAVSFGEGVRP